MVFSSIVFLCILLPVVLILHTVVPNKTFRNILLLVASLLFYSFGMVGYAVCEILNKSFYALKDGKTPMVTSILGVAVNFISAFVFVRLFKMGVGGLALASAVSSSFMGIVLAVLINRKRRGITDFSFVLNFLKILFAAALSFTAAKFVYMWVAPKLGGGVVLTLAGLCAASLPALLVYAVAGFLLKTDEVMFFRRKKCDE